MLKVFNNDLFVCGIDEAGRGSLAGPVTAAAVILPKNYINNEIRDSKKINKPTRLKLFEEIVNISVAYSIIDISNKTIDTINILESTFLAMNKAISKLKKKPDYILCSVWSTSHALRRDVQATRDPDLLPLHPAPAVVKKFPSIPRHLW